MHPELPPRPEPHSIADRVRAELHWIDHFDASTLFVSETGGAVTIRGVVHNWSERDNAVRAARAVPGVRTIDVEDLKIRVGRTDDPTDAELARAARDSLRWNLSVPHNAVHARASGGKVILEGRVTNLWQRQQAEASVRALLGARGIVDLVHVGIRTA